MKRLVFGITGLTMGGAEKVLVDLANELCSEYDITIFTLYSKGVLEKELDSRIKLVSMYEKSYQELTNTQKKVIIPLKVLCEKRKIYNKYIKGKFDKQIAFLEGPITRIFACEQDKTKSIAWVHSDITKIFGNDIKSIFKRKIDKRVYGKYSNIVFVSKDNMTQFNKQFGGLNCKLNVIHNYINLNKIINMSDEFKPNEFNMQNGEIKLLTVARLVEAKALDRFIKVHSKLVKDGIKHSLYIIGDGPEKEKLEKVINQERCQDSTFLLGQKTNPYPYMKYADAICLFSKFEGYGMVLEEGKALGKYIMITDTAAKEALVGYDRCKIVENSENGIYNGIKDFVENRDFEYEEMQRQYSNNNILQQIKELFI